MFKVNNKINTDVVLLFLLLTLNIFQAFFYCCFEQVNIGWVYTNLFNPLAPGIHKKAIHVQTNLLVDTKERLNKTQLIISQGNNGKFILEI